MRHMEFCRKRTHLDTEEDLTLIYYVTIDEFGDLQSGIELESFGVGVTICENGETEFVSNVTFSCAEVLSLAALLATHLVTPVTVRDIVEDWLCSEKI